ncbi:MAG: hypothetical protein IJN24_01300 [Bacteroidaceae bacterium]|nr:hypothetical protein [Bacteroidaceae bacterium]MBQ6693493.1 hypothetical protein [Bacteroidaceae bacterium]
MKKVAFNLLLLVAIVGLAFICYRSIMDPIEFEEQRGAREKDIIARLIDIRTAQIEYRNNHQGAYTDNFDTLIDYIKTAQMPIVLKVGELNDEQLERGLTEKKVLEMIAKAEKTGKWADVEKEGLRDFRRDTTWIALVDTIYGKGFNVDSLKYVPYSNGAQFELATSCDTTKSGSAQWLFEARTPFETYLTGINDQEMKNLISAQKKLGRYCGLKVGDVEQPNNNAGNWE